MKKIISIATIVLLIIWLLNIVIYNDANFKTKNTKSTFNPSKKDYSYYLKRIRLDRKWMENLKNQAEERDISTDSMLSITAREWAEKQKHE